MAGFSFPLGALPRLWVGCPDIVKAVREKLKEGVFIFWNVSKSRALR
jgi:hypothetical protein